jgi:Domain of unknown function (DUF1840)
MLYKFKSKAAADLIMLQPNGQRILSIMGKETAAPAGDKGIVLPQDMPAAISALEAAIVQEETQQKAAQEAALSRGETPPRLEGISLRQRAVPMIEMLRRCEKAGEPIVWGV